MSDLGVKGKSTRELPAKDHVDLDSQASSVHQAHAEIPLTAAVENLVCKQGRRRLRELQASLPVKIRYERNRGVLKVAGTADSIAAVQAYLERLGGVRRKVSTAAWCELMRIRLEETLPDSELRRMQAQSGCRIHIERCLREVRLFGSSQEVELALCLLEDFAKHCGEAAVPLGEEGHSSIPDPVAEDITSLHGVTLNVEKRRAVVYGRHGAVAEAVRALEAHLRGDADAVEKHVSVDALLSADVETDDDWDDGTRSSCSLSSKGSWYPASRMSQFQEDETGQHQVGRQPSVTEQRPSPA